MTTYETLDAIAGAFNPAQALIALATFVPLARRRRGREALLRVAFLVAALALVYLGKFVLKPAFAWMGVGFGFSTHVAFGLALTAYLWIALAARWRAVWVATLLAYVALVVYQGYHALADVIATVVLLAPPLGAMVLRFQRRQIAGP